MIVIQFNKNNEEISIMIAVFDAMSFLLMNITHSNTSNTQKYEVKIVHNKAYKYICALLLSF